MIWANTTHIGCGLVIAKDENKNDKDPSYIIYHLVCNYGPRGNVEGHAVYKAKNTCECSNF